MPNIDYLQLALEIDEFREKGKESFQYRTEESPIEILEEFGEPFDVEVPEAINREELERRDDEYFEDYIWALDSMRREAGSQIES